MKVQEKNKKELKISNTTTILAKKLEAILFLEAKYVSKKELTEKLACNMKDIETALSLLKNKYIKNNHAFYVEESKGGIMLMIDRKGIEDIIVTYEVIKKEGLSRTVLETLAIIAYSQPITKSEINSIRGVNSNNAVSYLLEKNIISIIGKRAIAGNPNEYITTSEFLKLFKLSSISELPSLEEKDKTLFIKQETENKA